MNKILLFKCMHKNFAGDGFITRNALLSLAMVCSLFYACSKKQAAVQMETPQAIKQIIENLEINGADCTCHPYISQYIWRNENIYVLAINDSLNIGYVCDWIPTFYYSNGQKLTLKTGYTYQDFLRDGHFIKNVWACE